MNMWQIVGFVITTIGVIVSFGGSIIQGKDQTLHQGKVEQHIAKRDEISQPKISVLGLSGVFPNILLNIKNVGDLPAKQVRLIYEKGETINIFSFNYISSLGEVPRGAELVMDMVLFSGYSLISKLPDTEENLEIKETINDQMKDYKDGNKVLIPKFHLEYKDEDKTIISPTYYFIIEKGQFYGLNAL
ncbi:MAG: hypothetical protein ACTSXQ_02285 [Alphaproteobacteria bacterium]